MKQTRPMIHLAISLRSQARAALTTMMYPRLFSQVYRELTGSYLGHWPWGTAKMTTVMITRVRSPYVYHRIIGSNSPPEGFEYVDTSLTSNLDTRWATATHVCRRSTCSLYTGPPSRLEVNRCGE